MGNGSKEVATAIPVHVHWPAGAAPGAAGSRLRDDLFAQGLAAVDEALAAMGLAGLTCEERESLVWGRASALEQTERVEFGEGPTARLADGILASPFFARKEFATCVAVLEGAFYRIKDETLEACPDEVALDELLAAFDEFAGDAEAAASIAADRLRQDWTPRDSPWSEGMYGEDEIRRLRGSSIPGWELAERALSVEYVLGEFDGCRWEQGAGPADHLAAGAEDGLARVFRASGEAVLCGDAPAYAGFRLANGVRGDVEFGLDADPLRGPDLDFDLLACAFDAGVARIRAKAVESRTLCERVRRGMPRPTSRSMRDTLVGIAHSFDLYDPVLAAHIVPCDIDYQLALPVPDGMVGIDYVHEYLRRLAVENDLLARCDPDGRTRLLDAWMPDWRDLVANLYEPVALAALRVAGVSGEGLHTPPGRVADTVACRLGLDEDGRAYLREFARQNAVLLR